MDYREVTNELILRYMAGSKKRVVSLARLKQSARIFPSSLRRPCSAVSMLTTIFPTRLTLKIGAGNVILPGTLKLLQLVVNHALELHEVF